MIVDENEVVNEDTSVEDEGKKTHLTFKDIDYLNNNLKPKWYHFESVDDKTHEVVKEWDDVFLEFDRVIAPLEYESMEITYSELSGDSMIETHVNYHFVDWSVYRVDYFNDRESLKYISAEIKLLELYIITSSIGPQSLKWFIISSIDIGSFRPSIINFSFWIPSI